MKNTELNAELSALYLRKTIKNKMIVREVSISLQQGECIGLFGPNGAGKTTVFYMLIGLLAADNGQIMLDGEDITNLPIYRRAQLGLGYLPQEASVFRGLSVEDNILAVLEFIEPNREKQNQRLTMLLDEFSLTHVRRAPSITLSGGERRRLEIARSLVTQPRFMLMDEPFAGIDPIAVTEIRQMVRALTKRGIGVLITDHNVRETLELIDRAYIIHDGNVLMEGTPTDIIKDAEVRRLYLGQDFTL